MAAVSHWHDDLEFIIILQGNMSYSVNGKEYTLQTVQGIFVNSKQLHYGYSMDGSDCKFLCMLLHPSLLYATERIKESYVMPICMNSTYPLLLLKPSVNWQREIIEILKQIYTLCNEQQDGFELGVLSLFQALWFRLYHNLNSNPASQENALDSKLQALHNMVGYIQRNYHNKIALNDIASAGNVCRSSCCEIFNNILYKTPISYLKAYRLEKSIELFSFNYGDSFTMWVYWFKLLYRNIS